ncbi:MAG: hypothetical protein NZ992_03320, partial [Candidatus Korarchaeum sp.]|nr:hypothetical protein [Candidatus Korarchaeum sp.]MDW8035215.1 hypothetical protein [Candidatus Korarchaeum sp.]
MRSGIKDLYITLVICLILLVALSSLLDLGPYEVPLLAIPLLALLLLGLEFEIPIRPMRVELTLASLPLLLLALSLTSPLPYSSLACMTLLILMFIPLAPFISEDPWESLGLSFSIGGITSALLMFLNTMMKVPTLEVITVLSLINCFLSIYLSLKGRSLWKNLKLK